MEKNDNLMKFVVFNQPLEKVYHFYFFSTSVIYFILFFLACCSFSPAAGFRAAADVPAACVCILSAWTGGGGCRWRAALLQSAPTQPAHYHEVPALKHAFHRLVRVKHPRIDALSP